MNFTYNFEQAKSGLYYTKENIPAFFTAAGEFDAVGGKKIKYYNVPASFDIETSSVMWGEQLPVGIMYCFSFCLNGAVYFGRTWDEFVDLVNAIVKHYHISQERRLRVYVRNLAFEFQFMRGWLQWREIFARQPREPMFALAENGIEFRCSLVLTNQSLKDSAKDLINHKIEKLTGELDYRLVRHSGTPMTEREIQYSINDVLIDAALIFDRIKSDGNVARIPLTNTGYTRRLCRRACLPSGAGRWKYARNIAQLTLTVDEYICALEAFAGGFCHASPLSVSDIIDDCASLDFTSAYPAGAVCEDCFPVSKGIEIDCRKITSREQLIHKADKFAFIGVFEFYGIESKTNVDYYISKSKCHKAEGIDEFNGRVASADYIQISLTNIDFLMILQLYDIKQIRVCRLWQYRKGRLPKEIVLTILEQYGKKTTLKGVTNEELPGAEEAYQQGKRHTNCIYGMMVTQLNRPEIEYDTQTGEWRVVPVDTTEKIEKYNNDDNRFISYLWGIFITAICRRNLWGAIIECGYDYHYSDTDSVKITNYEKHKTYFDRYNDEIDAKMKAAADDLGFDFELTRPKTRKGVKKPLGQWDFEGVYTMAKFLNAKRYIYVLNDQLHVTIAGTGKVTTANYLMAKYKTFNAVFDAFNDGMKIDGELRDENGNIVGGTGKLTHIYNDHEVEIDITDYTGSTQTCFEKSSVYLEPCDYAVGFSGEFLHFVERMGKNLAAVRAVPV